VRIISFLDKFNKAKQTIKQKFLTGYYGQQILIPPNLSTADFLRTYGETGWLFACTSKIAQNVADVEWSAYKNDKEITNSQALSVLQNPNQFMSQYELIELTDMYLSLTGKAFWYIAKDKAGRSREIWPISPIDMWILPDTENFAKGYMYRAGAETIPFDVDEIIFFKMPNPFNPYDGVGPAQGVRNSLEVDKYSAQHNRNFFYNGANISGILSIEQNMDDETYERLRADFEDKYRGVDNAHRIAFIEGGKANFTSLTMNQKDMDFYNLRQLTRDEILGGFGVHKSILGLTDDVSRANAETAEYVFQKHVIRPRLRRIQDKLNHEFVQMFKEEIVIKFTDPVPENKEFLVTTVQQLTNVAITVNEGRQILNKLLDDVNLDPVDGGDIIYQNNMLAPLGSSSVENIEQDTGNKIFKKKISKQAKVKLKKLIEKSNQTRIKQRDKISKPLEVEFEASVKAYFDEMKKNIIEKFKSGNNDPVDTAKWNKVLESILNPLYKKIVKIGGQAVVSEFKGYEALLTKDVGDTGIDDYDIYFDFKDPAVSKMIKNKLMKIKGINQLTKDSVATLIKQSYESEEGFTIPQIAELIGNMPDFDQARANKIAQTEVISSLNQSTIITYKQNSHLIDGKAWLSNNDSHTRETHLQAGMDYSEDNPISVDDYFNVGGYDCECPGDDELPAEEVVNCRCCMQPVVNS
jgi:HK97 family phage portal protein